ncbi:MAG: 50S ribosomal protein L24 [Parcubacteria group bacterium GW2011_GWD2_43_10]|uniref:Large ribosomal subunit protein uL24 n=4 Tax=Candidatus Vebleniibacteriota TaxID=1817921 RepID=A0A1G2QAX5_9BACT|nr:MAG: 50S ribosomal protein L24 [Parcubacteria group bacterium GW2011_GWA2_42_80]KKS78564.1 MAG: 50S ribosomal protein L24 [Parcubacteria group bacterium GW2011_GWD1_42_9]KKS83200.1 MAG: 50S ribosomal protein L24 [Parcubacteria group bacterium GW2011_GWD2_43_10]KKS92885.1 MAG: 50S ribosomal protein L24 [Parcubacteria group bacterium GW2011_GWE2_43_12]KKT13432.1 MAG: 50S ribosomal protein L24 [Parcubacteria group bacterium GW2011_GWA1_43_27]KKT14968.1 MAG: 50S ribosomal protein L24 [Parcubact
MINKIKKNDTVVVLSGRDKGKQGKVTQLFPRLRMLVVEGVNVRVKHLRTRQRGRTGSRVQYAAPLPIAKVSLICPHCGKPTRVRVEVGADNKRIRLCRKCSASM